MSSWLTTAIGKLLREKRFEAQLSLAALSAVSGVPVRQLSKLERGSVDADLMTLESVTRALELPINELIDNAYRLDDERVLFIGEDALAPTLAKAYRHIVSAEQGCSVVE